MEMGTQIGQTTILFTKWGKAVMVTVTARTEETITVQDGSSKEFTFPTSSIRTLKAGASEIVDPWQTAK